MANHKQYIQRCIELAQKATKAIKNNPPVGAVIVYQNRIIGEGYHMKQGEAHAEINALNSVAIKDRSHIPESRLYVSLEPCCHYGKTPPCVEAIVKNKIKEVYISCLDPTDKVAGKGVEYLENNNIKVYTNILQLAGEELIKRFKINHQESRPKVTLKWANSYDGYMGKENQQIWLSNEYCKIHSHKLRSECDGILIGTNTVMIDNPSLTNRQYSGENPIRIVLDYDHKIPLSQYILKDNSIKTWIVTNKISTRYKSDHIEQIIHKQEDGLFSLLQKLYQKGINQLIIEGGKQVLQSFINEKMWDEAYIYQTNKIMKEGIKSPNLDGQLIQKTQVDNDIIKHISRYHVKNS